MSDRGKWITEAMQRWERFTFDGDTKQLTIFGERDFVYFDGHASSCPALLLCALTAQAPQPAGPKTGS